MKTKWLASLILASSLTSCSVGYEPPSSPPSPPVQAITLGEDGCPIEEPCFGYEAEDESIANAMEAQAWATFDSYNLTPLNASHTLQVEYVGWTDSSAPEASGAYWSIVDPNNHDVVYIFQSVALTAV